MNGGSVRASTARKRIVIVAFTLSAATVFPSAAGAAVTTVGRGGWQVQSSKQATQGGAVISGPGFTPGSWLQVRPDNAGAPVFWSDNDITLWPGESQTLHVSYRRRDLNGASPVVTVGGWNLTTLNVRG
jgi:Exo-beta-D-glucosaminidase Ig-fold domain